MKIDPYETFNIIANQIRYNLYSGNAYRPIGKKIDITKLKIPKLISGVSEK